MKKAVLAMALIGAGITAAQAQSSVTLYGLIDAGVSYVSHTATATGGSAHNFKYDDGVASASRWGIKGTEDLGSGLSAIFTVEGGFNSGTGTASQGGTEFGRQAFVGLNKQGMGSVTLGRQYSFSTEFLGPLSQGGLTASGNYGYHINDIDQLSSSRINNSVKVTSATYRGFKAGALYGFSDSAGHFDGNNTAGTGASRAYSVGLSYANGPFAAAAAYTDISYPAASAPAFPVAIANVAMGTGTSSLAIKNLRTAGLGANYTFGNAVVFGMWTNTHFLPVDASASTANIFEGGLRYSLTPALNVSGAYAFTDLTGNKSGKWHQVNASADYSFSKRTDVYVLAAYQKADGSNGGIANQAEIGSNNNFLGSSGSGASNQIAARVGLRHRF